jgi:hypothetical protein
MRKVREKYEEKMREEREEREAAEAKLKEMISMREAAEAELKEMISMREAEEARYKYFKEKYQRQVEKITNSEIERELKKQINFDYNSTMLNKSNKFRKNV